MQKSYCHLTQIPLRAEPRSSSEMVSQLIYGESYTILESQKEWSRIRMDYDGYEGWISNASLHTGEALSGLLIQQELFHVNFVEEQMIISTMGSELSPAFMMNEEQKTKDIREIALHFLHVPYLWGGRTFTGIDCSGLVQIVYKTFGIALPRDASQQQKEGRAIRFGNIMEGDLVFFDRDARITHVGIAIGNGEIIHAHGCVRIDALNPKGIFNREQQKLTHHYHSAKRLR